MISLLVRQAIGFVRALRALGFRIGIANGSLSVGDDFVVGPRSRVARGVHVVGGDRVNIAADLNLQTDLRVGDDVMISSHVAMVGNDHDFSDPAKTLHEQGRLPRKEVVLEGDNLVGYGTILIAPVTVGRGTIVGAGSLVTHDLPPNTVCVGRPAKPIRQRR